MKKITLILCAVLILGFVAFVNATNNGATDWTCFQKDEQRRGQASSSDKLATPLSKAWETKLPDKPRGTVIIGKDMAVVSTEKGSIVAFSLLTGKEVWKRDLAIPVTTDMALSDEIVLVPTKGGKIFGLDLYTGGTFWDYQARGEIKSPPLSYLGQFYLVTVEGHIFSLMAGSGLPLLSFDLGDKVEAPMTILPTYSTGSQFTSLLVSTLSGKLLMFDTVMKEVKWVMDLERATPHAVIPAGETLLLTFDTGTVKSLSATDRKQFWMVETGKPVNSAPCTFSSGIYMAFASTAGDISCIRLGDGMKVWENKALGKISQPLIGIDMNVIALTDNGHVQVFYAFDGSMVADFSVGENISIVTPPSYSTNSILFGTSENKLVCVRPSAGGLSIKLDPFVTVLAPGQSKNVKIILTGNPEITSDFTLIPLNFPCKCKITRTIIHPSSKLPNSVTKIGEDRDLKLDAAVDAESYAYEYQVKAYSSTDSNMSVSATAFVIIAKTDETLNGNIKPEVSGNKVKLTVGYKNGKYMRSFAGMLRFDQSLLKPISVKNLAQDISSLTSDIAYPGEVRLFSAVNSNKQSYPPELDVFVVEFEILKSGKAKIDFILSSRSMSGGILPSLPLGVELDLVRPKIEHVVTLQIGNLMAKIDGGEVKLKVAPYIKSGKTMVPLRFIGDALSAGIEWIEKEKAVVYTNTLDTGARLVKMWIGKTIAIVDGKEVEVKPAPEIKSGNTCVGLSFVSSNFGVTTNWDAKTKTVTLKYSK